MARAHHQRRGKAIATETDTRARILAAALRLFLEDGYEQTTVAKIREASGVSNGALFHRFSSKEAIAAALYVDAIKSFQDEHWRILDSEAPATLREMVDAIVGHQLRWIQDNPDAAQFVYDRGQLDWSPEAEADLIQLNKKLVEAYRTWLTPFRERGELRPLSTTLLGAIVGGPTHQIAQRWLRGSRSKPLVEFAPELSHAAWAAVVEPSVLAGDAAAHPGPPRAATPARVRIQLLDEDGRALSETEADLPPA